ncbi:MAG: L-histidine N(alpha)-methyltransferase [Beijerinckiaceae bacterium]|nr:L-histidine N(alpha)-methyltransferase [Beijerinckiaceae bacterium]
MPSPNEALLRSVQEPEPGFAASVIEGLSKPRKSLPCRYFYDAWGSELFEEITRLPEYYLTRTEITILEAHAAEIALDAASAAVLVEFGSGSSRKTEILLDALPRLRAYVPVDVSQSAIEGARHRLRNRYPSLHVHPILADFSQPQGLPPSLAREHKLGFFPGSTIGNFPPFAAIRLLRSMRGTLSRGGRLIIGVDLKKDARTLLRAYNDKAGITAAFNLNLLTRINRELEGTFDLSSFRHEAIYNSKEGRIEMHIVSKQKQTVSVLGRRFGFFAGETIHTENSYKYSTAQFQELAHAAGWQLDCAWNDGDKLFCVMTLA